METTNGNDCPLDFAKPDWFNTEPKGWISPKCGSGVSPNVNICPCTEPLGYDWGNNQQSCLHDQCIECGGTGLKKGGGFCVHHLSCSCPKCSPTCL